MYIGGSIPPYSIIGIDKMVKFIISNLVITVTFIGITIGLMILEILGTLSTFYAILCLTIIYVVIAYAYGLSVKYLNIK